MSCSLYASASLTSMSDWQATVFQTFLHPSTIMYVWLLEVDFTRTRSRQCLWNRSSKQFKVEMHPSIQNKIEMNWLWNSVTKKKAHRRLQRTKQLNNQKGKQFIQACQMCRYHFVPAGSEGKGRRWPTRANWEFECENNTLYASITQANTTGFHNLLWCTLYTERAS